MAQVLPFAPQGRDVDLEFFNDHPDRKSHIRPAFDGENKKEFRELGFHDAKRRVIILWRVPVGHPVAPGGICKIPMILFSDESVTDDDATLLPIIDELMHNAAENYGMKPRRQ